MTHSKSGPGSSAGSIALVSSSSADDERRLKKILIYFIITSLVVFTVTGFFVGFVNVDSARAQEADSRSDVTLDMTVDSEDLGIGEPGILPGSFLYGFKNAIRGMRHTLTFGDERKANLEMRYANERLMEAKKLLEISEEDDIDESDRLKAKSLALKTLRYYQDTVNMAMNRAENIKDSEEKSSIMGLAVGKLLKQDRIIESMEDKLWNAGDDVSDIVANKKMVRDKIGFAIANSGKNPEELAVELQSVIDRQGGSDFKYFKLLEVLESAQDRVDGKARDRIDALRDKFRERFESDFSKMPDDVRKSKLKAYIENVPGDAILQLEVLDEIKSKGSIPEDAFSDIEMFKQVAARKFLRRIQNAPEYLQDDMMDVLGEGDEFENLRSINELMSRLPEESLPPKVRERIAEREKNSIEKIRGFIGYGPNDDEDMSDKMKRLMGEVRENPNVATFRALGKLKENLAPEQKRFILKLEEEGANEIARKFSEQGEGFLKRIETGNLDDIEIFENLRDVADSSKRRYGAVENPFSRLQDLQVDSVAEYIKQTEDIEEIRRIKKQLEDNPVILDRINKSNAIGKSVGMKSMLEAREEMIKETLKLEDDMDIDDDSREDELEESDRQNMKNKSIRAKSGIRKNTGIKKSDLPKGMPDNVRMNDDEDSEDSREEGVETFDSHTKRKSEGRLNGKSEDATRIRPRSIKRIKTDESKGLNKLNRLNDGVVRVASVSRPVSVGILRFDSGPFPVSKNVGLIQDLPGKPEVLGASTMWDTPKKDAIVGGPIPNIMSRSLPIDMISYFFKLITFTYDK